MSDVEKDIENIERLIVRKLDGELSEDEELELNRELIRDPEARRLMEEYARIDGLAAAALSEALGDGSLSVDPAMLQDQGRRRAARGYNRGWWLVPGAIAAALLAIMLARFTPSAPTDQEIIAEQPRPSTRRVPAVSPGYQPGGLSHQAGYEQGPEKIRRDTGREVIGVVGDDGNIYWIEIDRIRTLKQPGTGWARPISLEEL